MRAIQLYGDTQGSLIAEYASRLGEALVRRRAEIAARAARVEAELAIKARSEFLSNMNHELRTPLNAIIGFATLLRDGGQYAVDEDQQRSYAEYILQSADLLLGHINTILDIAALESGNVELVQDEIDTGAIVESIAGRVRVSADTAEVKIEFHDANDSVLAWGDAERTGQALEHILQTAIKACGKGGRVKIAVGRNQNAWPEILIADNSEGMTPDELEKALAIFEEVHRGLDQSFSKPGVGYAVAKTFIEMQSGHFGIKSHKGKGTRIRISLPPTKECVREQNNNAKFEQPLNDREKNSDAA